MTRANVGPGPGIGRAMKTLRERKGLSLAQAASAMGLGAKSYLHKLESGGVPNPSINTVMAAADVLGVTVGELIGEQPRVTVRDAAVEVELRRALRRIGRDAIAAASGEPSA